MNNQSEINLSLWKNAEYLRLMSEPVVVSGREYLSGIINALESLGKLNHRVLTFDNPEQISLQKDAAIKAADLLIEIKQNISFWTDISRTIDDLVEELDDPEGIISLIISEVDGLRPVTIPYGYGYGYNPSGYGYGYGYEGSENYFELIEQFQ